MSHAMMISLGLLVVCFVIRMPIAIGMIISSTLYLAVKGMDPSVVVEIFTSKMYNNFILLAVPLFIFAANIMNSSKVTDKIFDFSKVLVGRWKGGLGHVNVIASLIFSGMTGSAVADASGLGIMEIEAMRKEGYDDGFSAAITAGSAVIGPIFPPSIPLVIYGVIAGASIGNLFLAGMVPGIILALALCIYVCYIANKRNYPSGRKYAGMEFIKMTVSAVPALLTPIILLMGILYRHHDCHRGRGSGSPIRPAHIRFCVPFHNTVRVYPGIEEYGEVYGTDWHYAGCCLCVFLCDCSGESSVSGRKSDSVFCHHKGFLSCFLSTYCCSYWGCCWIQLFYSWYCCLSYVR